MTDKEKLRWIKSRMDEVTCAFKNPNDEDKYHALEMMEHMVQRVKAAVLADICISSKAYPAKTSPWFTKENQ